MKMAPSPSESFPGIFPDAQPQLEQSPKSLFIQSQLPDEKENREDDLRRKKRERFRAMLRMERPFGYDQILIGQIFVVSNHLAGAYGLYLILNGYFPFSVLLFQFIYSYIGALGTTIGAHRYWTHKSFKAKTPLRVLLMCMQTITVQYGIYKWVLDHRIHHKFTDTDKDPHNSKRGFWFSQILWTVTKKHPDHQEKLESFDMPDLEKDKIVIFQAKWYPLLAYLFYHAIPTYAIWYFWGISGLEVNCLNCFRWVYNTHISSAVNSFAHIYGDRPFDKDLTSADNRIVSIFAVGEGWHNYHHTFPWDYKTSEFGWKINLSTIFIDFFAWIGWAYDLKTVSQEMLIEKVKKSGDGSHWSHGHNHNDENGNKLETSQLKMDCDSSATWGWDDNSISDEFRQMTLTLKGVKN